MAIFLILITIAYASLDSLTHSNFTVIGNLPGNFYYFFAWTVLTATFFLYNSIHLMKKFHYSFPYQKIICSYIYLACITTPLIPYTEKNPFLDDLHVFLAMSSSFLFLWVWGMFLWHLKSTYPTITHKIELPFWILIQTLLGCIFFFNQINSVIELLLVISMIILIDFLKKS